VRAYPCLPTLQLLLRYVLAQANESGLMSRVAFLRKVKLLEGLGDNQVTRIAGALTEEDFKDGHYIITQVKRGAHVGAKKPRSTGS